ncbi:hypothetical protein Sjap_009196 [Stephania japonica]|uniref:WAT1-related protein n=1 Tax=Stephania japonica TaxID=461633 RepID=A0AAP0JTD2_9MAGN
MVISSTLWSRAKLAAPHAGMITVQIITAVYIVLTQVIVVQGISSPVFLFYVFIIATIFMGSLAFIFERKLRPPITKYILCCIFLMALLGITFMQNTMVACLDFINGTVEAAVLNMVPIFTYVLSVISRQEKAMLNTLWGKGKLFGTLLSVSGALTLVLWNGPSVIKLSTSIQATSLGHWILGLVMVVAGVFALSLWILLLGPMTRLYSAEFSLTTIMFAFAVLQQALVAAILSHNSSQWKLKWNLELVNIFVGGTLNSGVANLFMTYCSSVKGPVFVGSFSPLGLVFTTILETVFLRSTLDLGRIIGAVMILAGLYIFLWSKSKEETFESIDGYDSID